MGFAEAATVRFIRCHSQFEFPRCCGHLTGNPLAQGGVLKVTIGGTDAGTYDMLDVVGGDVTLDGFLDIILDNFSPGTGNPFRVLGFTGQRQGTFQQVRPDGNTVNWTADYSPDHAVDVRS